MNVIAISNTLYKDSSLLRKKDCKHIFSKKDLTIEALSELRPSYVFFPHWSYIIPPEIYENFNCVIFHMTDLPFGRGGSPLQNLISRGIYKTKISALKCTGVLDGGDIFLKRDFDISDGSASELYAQAGEIVSLMIDDIIINNPIPVPQVGAPTIFRCRQKQESNLSSVKSVRGLYDYIRMLDADGYPKAFLEMNGLRYEFSNAHLQNGKVMATVTMEEIHE